VVSNATANFSGALRSSAGGESSVASPSAAAAGASLFGSPSETREAGSSWSLPQPTSSAIARVMVIGAFLRMARRCHGSPHRGRSASKSRIVREEGLLRTLRISRRENERMGGLVYKVIEVTGTSPDGVKAAVAQGLERVRDDGLAIRFFVIKDTEVVAAPTG